ncbi:rhomboid-like protein [Actinomycetes bacterium M1A6_2h]
MTTVTDRPALEERPVSASALRRVGSALWSVRVTTVYAALIIAASVGLSQLSDSAQDRFLLLASTNLHNLLHGHVGTLVVSAFVTDGGATWVWLPGLVCLLAVAEILWRSRRLFALFALGHVGATLLVAAGLFFAVRHGAVPMSVVRAEDVGVSYGAAAVIGALTWALPTTYRAPWAAMWFAVTGVAVAVEHDFTAVGHLTAVTIGMLAAYRWIRPNAVDLRDYNKTALRTLLAVGTVFALAEVGWQDYWWTVPVVAAVAATVTYTLTAYRTTTVRLTRA